MGDHGVIGIEPTDSPDELAALTCLYAGARRFAYRGTAGDRNLHVMSGRIE